MKLNITSFLRIITLKAFISFKPCTFDENSLRTIVAPDINKKDRRVGPYLHVKDLSR